MLALALLGFVPGTARAAYILSPNSAPVNVRVNPGVDQGLLRTAKTGTEVTVLEPGDEWTKILIGGQEGYVLTDYLTETDPLSDDPVDDGKRYVISPNSAPVNVRREPSTSSESIMQVVTGTEVEVIEPGDEWTEIEVDGEDGYILTDFLSEEDPYAPENEDDSIRYVRSPNSAPVNFREQPSTRGKLIAQLVTGTEVTLLDETGEWSRVMLGDQMGYIFTEYLTRTQQTTYTSAVYAYVVSPNGGDVRVRYGAGTTYHVMTTVQPGTEVQVLAVQSGWARVRFDDKEGYIDVNYLSISEGF
ncbi:MAG: SH3 domain-containing protein [Clostridia bacterium]|nr:SH3 domain-containing protein [Clostridia bacterium]